MKPPANAAADAQAKTRLHQNSRTLDELESKKGRNRQTEKRQRSTFGSVAITVRRSLFRFCFIFRTFSCEARSQNKEHMISVSLSMMTYFKVDRYFSATRCSRFAPFFPRNLVSRDRVTSNAERLDCSSLIVCRLIDGRLWRPIVTGSSVLKRRKILFRSDHCDLD